jgi:bacteriocin biosynthesis cyclodehydratase domain-containing protein
MVLRLDPRVPIVWRTPDTIQLGIDRPLAVIAGMTPALERVLVALRSGVPREGALMLGNEAGASNFQIDVLLQALRPALLSPPATDAPQAGRVCVDGTGRTADRLRELLSDLGLSVITLHEPGHGADRAAGDSIPDAALAVIVSHYVIEPERHGRWLRRDIPHLPVVFSDTQVRYGPLVEPGSGPCLTCLELQRLDDDPDWPAIAVQLMSRRAPTETPLVSTEVASAVARLIAARLLSGPSSGESLSYAHDAETGTVTRRAHLPHGRCGCRSLTGNATSPEERVVALRTLPSSATAAGAPG